MVLHRPVELAVDNGVYHVVDRWTPHKNAYAILCLYMLELSKIKVDAKEVY
jgi:hypothetical protein